MIRTDDTSYASEPQNHVPTRNLSLEHLLNDVYAVVRTQSFAEFLCRSRSVHPMMMKTHAADAAAAAVVERLTRLRPVRDQGRRSIRRGRFPGVWAIIWVENLIGKWSKVLGTNVGRDPNYCRTTCLLNFH